MIDFKIKKKTNMVTRDQIIDYLDKKFWEEKQYECMPENEHGYEYVPREALEKIVDGLIPMIKNMMKQKVNSSNATLNNIEITDLKSQLAEAGEEKRNELIKAYSDLVTEIDKHKGTTIKEVKLRNKIANLKLEIR